MSRENSDSGREKEEMCDRKREGVDYSVPFAQLLFSCERMRNEVRRECKKKGRKEKNRKKERKEKLQRGKKRMMCKKRARKENETNVSLSKISHWKRIKSLFLFSNSSSFSIHYFSSLSLSLYLSLQMYPSHIPGNVPYLNMTVKVSFPPSVMAISLPSSFSSLLLFFSSSMNLPFIIPLPQLTPSHQHPSSNGGFVMKTVFNLPFLYFSLPQFLAQLCIVFYFRTLFLCFFYLNFYLFSSLSL